MFSTLCRPSSGVSSSTIARRRDQIEAGDLSDAKRFGAVVSALEAIPDHIAPLDEATQGRLVLGARQQRRSRQSLDEGGERRLVFRHGRKDVDVVVDQRTDQQGVGVVEGELGAAVLVRGDVFVALDQEHRVATGVAGGGQVQRHGPDEVARIAAGFAHQHGAEGGQGRLAEAAGDRRSSGARGCARRGTRGSWPGVRPGASARSVPGSRPGPAWRCRRRWPRPDSCGRAAGSKPSRQGMPSRFRRSLTGGKTPLSDPETLCPSEASTEASALIPAPAMPRK